MNYNFKVRKYGKTRGRPSKQEKTIETVYNYWYKNHKKVYDKMVKDALLYGVGISKVSLRKFYK